MYRPCLHCENGRYEKNYCPEICTYGEEKKRLAAYEDTGLMPEEIVKMGMAWEDSKRYSGRLEGKLKAYEEAKAEGRLKVLPCAVDATAYYADADAGRVLMGYVADYEFLRGGDCYFNFYNVESDIEWVSVELPIEEFGKTVFLTREEAKAALNGGDGDGNEA